MTETEWRGRYALRIMHVTHCDEDFARNCAEAVALGDGWYDLDEDSPEDAADDEMAEWTCDG